MLSPVASDPAKQMDSTAHSLQRLWRADRITGFQSSIQFVLPEQKQSPRNVAARHSTFYILNKKILTFMRQQMPRILRQKTKTGSADDVFLNDAQRDLLYVNI